MTCICFQPDLTSPPYLSLLFVPAIEENRIFMLGVVFFDYSIRNKRDHPNSLSAYRHIGISDCHQFGLSAYDVPSFEKSVAS